VKVFGIGYQGRSLANLCQVLADENVNLLIDVRARAWSNRPEYRKGRLTDALASHGIEYVHLREAGNPFRPKPGEEMDASECLARYSEYLKVNPDVVSSVRALTRTRRVALMCYESESSACHRGAILAALKIRSTDL
jgi:uncharacterized protein (DUF488 family)